MPYAVSLPISKSIANRLLILQARAGMPLLPIEDDTPDDVRILHDALAQLREKTATSPVINVDNCGTAMRFLAAYCALANKPALLTGCPRMLQRPIGQLVDPLRALGANIAYIGQEGFPPLRIMPCTKPLPDLPRVVLNRPQSTQFVSALLLMGVEVETDSPSPYIAMTKQCIAQLSTLHSPLSTLNSPLSTFLERDWSSAAFWYEWVALHGGELLLQGLTDISLQGDRQVASLFEPLGVSTTFTPEGALITNTRASVRSYSIPPSPVARDGEGLTLDFAACPDLYPAVAITCEQLGIPLQATGTETLRIKESDRLQAVAERKTYSDHRIAMALLAADLLCDNTDCIKKSYPNFLSQLDSLKTQITQITQSTRNTPITPVIPRRGINDEGKGKKHALRRLITQAATDYVWLMDDDIVHAPALHSGVMPALAPDLLILPLRMQTAPDHTPNLLERLQMAEYAAIQGLTVLTAKHGHPVMCSSANLIVRRDRWLESYSDLHPELASGDDMFLLESFKRRGLRIAVSENEDLTAIVRPVPTWRAFFCQRMRWAGKAPAYQDRDILLCGAIVLTANILQLLCPPIMLVKFPIEYVLIRSREPKTTVWTALLLEIVYPFYLLYALIGGMKAVKAQKGSAF
ncbi:MAG: glycosyltransferase [Paludibacteraceae bacterium]